MSVSEVTQWLATLQPGDQIGIDDGGVCLRTAAGEAWLEVGLFPDAEQATWEQQLFDPSDDVGIDHSSILSAIRSFQPNTKEAVDDVQNTHASSAASHSEKRQDHHGVPRIQEPAGDTPRADVLRRQDDGVRDVDAGHGAAGAHDAGVGEGHREPSEGGMSTTETKHHVTWEIDVDAVGPTEAARTAWGIMRHPYSMANIFTVSAADWGKWVVDLSGPLERARHASSNTEASKAADGHAGRGRVADAQPEPDETETQRLQASMGRYIATADKPLSLIRMAADAVDGDGHRTAATILYGLRLAQAKFAGDEAPELNDILDEPEEPCLTPEEIGELCEAINMGGPAKKAFRFRCPKCSATDSIDVHVSTSARIIQTGPDSFETDTDLANDHSHDWHGDSYAVCRACGHGESICYFDTRGKKC